MLELKQIREKGQPTGAIAIVSNEKLNDYKYETVEVCYKRNRNTWYGSHKQYYYGDKQAIRSQRMSEKELESTIDAYRLKKLLPDYLTSVIGENNERHGE